MRLLYQVRLLFVFSFIWCIFGFVFIIVVGRNHHFSFNAAFNDSDSLSSSSPSSSSALSSTANDTSINTIDYRIIFAHVGKTGGVTIRKISTMGCFSFNRPSSRDACMDRLTSTSNQSQINRTIIRVNHCDRSFHRPVRELRASTTTMTTTTATTSPTSSTPARIDNTTTKTKTTTTRNSAKTSSQSLSSMASGRVEIVNAYLFSVRNPIDRIISWFDYMNPSNCVSEGGIEMPGCILVKKQRNRRRSVRDTYRREQEQQQGKTQSVKELELQLPAPGWMYGFYHRCFSTAEDFLQSLQVPDTRQVELEVTLTGNYSKSVVRERNKRMLNSNGTYVINKSHEKTYTCSDLAWGGILGQEVAANHLFYNYRYYTHQGDGGFDPTNPGQVAMVVRTEHLWDDINSIEQKVLGGSVPLDRREYGPDSTHGSERHVNKTKSLSQLSKHILCCAIQDEISIYVSLLNRAINLDDGGREETLQYLWDTCSSDSSTPSPSSTTDTNVINNMDMKSSTSASVAASTTHKAGAVETTTISSLTELAHVCKTVESMFPPERLFRQ